MIKKHITFAICSIIVVGLVVTAAAITDAKGQDAADPQDGDIIAVEATPGVTADLIINTSQPAGGVDVVPRDYPLRSVVVVIDGQDDIAAEIASMREELAQMRGELASLSVCVSSVIAHDGPDLVPGGSGLVNINTATAQELELLPRIGPVRAAAIVAARIEHGPFASIDHLVQVPGVGPATIEALRDLITVGGDE